MPMPEWLLSGKRRAYSSPPKPIDGKQAAVAEGKISTDVPPPDTASTSNTAAAFVDKKNFLASLYSENIT